MTSMQHGGNIYTERTNAPDLLDFYANINPFGVSESVKQAISAAIPTLVHYPDPQQTALTQAIATYHALQPEQIVCGNVGQMYSFGRCSVCIRNEPCCPFRLF